MQALASAVCSLEAVEDSMSIKDIMSMVKEYSKQSEKLGLKQEMMEDALEMGMDTGEVGADADQIYSEICNEIGVDQSVENQINSGALGFESSQKQNAGGLKGGI